MAGLKLINMVTELIRAQVLKDIIIKFQLMKGRRAVYVPGWDCHGLPIELKVCSPVSDILLNLAGRCCRPWPHIC